MTCRIAILGDSSSSGIGFGQACYPAKLFRLLEVEFPVEILNCAVPGFTSADANRFFHAELAQNLPDYLIVYLGNNEGAIGKPKGHYNRFKTWLSECLFGRPGRRFSPVLSPPRLRFEYGVPPRTIAVSPAEFGANLRSIVRSATKRRARVIIINPIANENFPCGLGMLNSSYFCYMDDLDRLGGPPDNSPIDTASEALATGLRRFTAGDYAGALRIWEPVSTEQNIAGFIARHNLACAGARLGRVDSREALGSLLGEHECYDSTVLYNMAHLAKSRDQQEEADRLLALALERDTSVYRIHRDYRTVMGSLTGAHGVQVLDLGSVLNSCDFVDYCHPTEEGHEKIADALVRLIGVPDRPTRVSQGSSYRVRLPSPDYVRAPHQTFCDYYCIDWPIAQTRIAAALGVAQSPPAGEVASATRTIEDCVRNFRHANNDHPVFTDNLRLTGSWMPMSHEILSCPENYLHRIMHNYAAVFEAEGLAAHLPRSSGLEHVRISASDYEKMILRASNDDLRMQIDIRPEYYQAIVDKMVGQLTSADRIYRVAIGERIRTLMTWYTREALRYGTHSRMSMLYPRWEIERFVEGSIVAVVIAARRGESRELQRLDGLLSVLLLLLQVHEHHVRLHHDRQPSFCADAYQSELDNLRERVGASLRAMSGA